MDAAGCVVSNKRNREREERGGQLYRNFTTGAREREIRGNKIPDRSRMIKASRHTSFAGADVSRLICPFTGVPNYESFERREDNSLIPYLVSIALLPIRIDPNRAADSPICSGPKEGQQVLSSTAGEHRYSRQSIETNTNASTVSCEELTS